MVFDVATGRIGFDDGFTVGPGLSMADARAHWPDAPIRDMHTGWMWLGARRVLIDGRAFAVDLGFHRHDLTYELMMVSMMLTLPGDELGWEGWTREAEDQRGVEHERWLLDCCGVTSGRHPWGRFGAGYDQKGGFSSVWLNFEPDDG